MIRSKGLRAANTSRDNEEASMSSIGSIGTQNAYNTALTAENAEQQATANAKSEARTTTDTVSLSAEAKAEKQAVASDAIARIHALGEAWENKLESSLSEAYAKPAEKDDTQKKTETRQEETPEAETSAYDQKVAQELLEGENADSAAAEVEVGTVSSENADPAPASQPSSQVLKLSSAYARMAAGKSTTFTTSA